MAEITFGIGTAHSSQVSLTADLWTAHGDLDKTRSNFDELLAKRGDSLADLLTQDVLDAKYERVQAGLSSVRGILDEAAPDVLVIIGDDQHELFRADGIPTISVFRGESVADLPQNTENMAPTHKASLWAMHGDVREDYPVCAPLATWIVEHGQKSGFDLHQLTEQPAERSLGHAYTFIRRRLMGDTPIPMVPIFLNTYFPPNQPTVGRCIQLGEELAASISSWSEDAKVGVVASGGLSHFVIDEDLDNLVLDALAAGDFDALRAIEANTFQSGTSEILNWVVAGAALSAANFKMKLLDYIPGYRSLAGTGCGMAFAHWT